MRSSPPGRLECARVTRGLMASDASSGMCGKFMITGPNGATLTIVATDAFLAESKGWEHVSVSLPNRCPNWPEMCFVKELFWDDEECVIQFHPPKSEYVNNHPYCLHMWRDLVSPPRMPSSHFVGVKDKGVMTNAERIQEARARGII